MPSLYTVCTYSFLKEKEIEQMSWLNFGPLGNMKDTLIKYAPLHPENYVFFIMSDKNEDDIIAAWALMTHNTTATDGLELDIFVHPAYRKMGYGYNLMTNIFKSMNVMPGLAERRIDVYPADEAGEKFFKQFDRCTIKDIDRWIPIHENQ